MSFTSLLPLIRKTGSTLTPPDFHKEINVVFHDEEAAHYDAIHKSMWDSLQEQLNLLASDVIQNAEFKNRELRLLDVGCGTGLSTQMLLDSPLGQYVSSVTLADTSSQMLQQAAQRAQLWERPYDMVNGTISELEGKYDIILVCSVLHHIPDLSDFLRNVSRLQDKGGIFLHLQDPNGDYFADRQYRERVAEYEKTIPVKKPDILKQLKRKLKRLIGKNDYIDRVNAELLRRKVIRVRMTAEEIWSVTDIHVEDLPFSTGSGISIQLLSEELSDYNRISTRSYGFFGPLKSELPSAFQHREKQLIRDNQLSGRQIGGSWLKSAAK